MPYESGTLLLVMYPHTDRVAAKIRPVVVISSKRFNRGSDFVVLPLSSRVLPNDPFGVVMEDTHTEFGETELRCSSTIKWTKPVTMSKTLVHAKLGKLPNDVLEEVKTKLATLFA